MVNRKWVGGNAGIWEVDGNWDPLGIPVLADDVTMTTGFATITTTIAINSITMSGSTIDVRNPGGTTTLTGGVTLSGAARVSLDASFVGGSGGNNLVIGGLLTNSSTAGLFIGNRGITEDDTVTAGGLVNTGSIRIFGTASAQSTLKVAGAAGFGEDGVARGVLYMETNALLQFDSGQIETINGTIWLNGIGARVTSGASLSTNSGLVGLKTVAGDLILQEGASVGATSGGLSIIDIGRVALDPAWIGGAGGSSLTIGGVLSNASTDVDALSIGNAAITLDVTVTAQELANAGTIQLTGSGTNSAFLKIASDAHNSGVIIVNGGGVIEDPNWLDSTGALKLAGGMIDTPTVYLYTTGTLTGNGTVDGSVSNDGYLEATDGVLVVTGGIIGAGLNKIGSDATLELGKGSPDTVVFNGASATLRLHTPAEFKGTIIGFDAFDMIDLRGIAGGTSATLDSNNVLHVLNSSSVEIASLQFAASNIGQSFTVGSDGAGGTMIAGGDIATTISIAPLLASKAEGDSGTTAFTFTVSLDQASFAPQTADWTVTGTGGNAADAADFGGVLPSGTVSFAAGETSQVVTILVSGDAAAELNEDFAVTLSNLTFGLLLGTASATGTILNDDKSVVSVTAGPGAKAEGTGGTSAFAWTVSLDRAALASQTVAWAITGSGVHAADGADLAGGVLPSGTLTFAPGETTKTVTVDVAGDTTVEFDEGLVLTLSAPSSGLDLGTTTMAGTIANDDLSAVSIAAQSASKAEGSSGTTAFTFTVTLSQAGVTSQTADWTVSGSGVNAADAADFGGALPAGTVTFAAGETSKVVTIDVAGDSAAEPNETFLVSLSNLSSGLELGTATASGTILDDDGSVSIAALLAAKAEGTGGTTAFTFTVTTTGDSSTTRSVAWAVVGSGASKADAVDFVGGALPTGVLTFQAGETSKVLTITVNGDTTVESDEGFLVSLSNPSSSLKIGTGSASGTIQNDDSIPITVTAHDDAYIVLEGQSLTIAAASGVLFNDQSASSASLLANAGHGAVQLAGTGGFTYTPAAGFTGIDSFTYHAVPGGNGVDGKAVLYVVPVNTGASTTLDLLGLTAAEQIGATYAAFFGRAADAGGHGFWVGQFVQNLPSQGAAALFANIASSFGISDEARALYPFLVDPFNATDAQISAFLDSVYNNLFNRSSDAGGLGYWTSQIKQTLQAGQFVGSVLVNIMSGAQDSAAGKDITTLMGKVAVSLAFVHEQEEHDTVWGAGDTAAATALLDAVTDAPQAILTGIRNAESLIANHI